jgi:hypothetical protein
MDLIISFAGLTQTAFSLHLEGGVGNPSDAQFRDIAASLLTEYKTITGDSTLDVYDINTTEGRSVSLTA